jgi:hypothetical protein
MDELVCMALSPVLAALFASNRASYDPDSGLCADGVPLEATLGEWSWVVDRLELLGLVSGSSLRRVHDAGYLRGLGSCWPGNEVIDEQGEVSVVDLDGGIESAGPYEATTAQGMRELELSRYYSFSHVILTDSRPRALGLFGRAFLEGVRRGYDDALSRSVPTTVLRSIVADHVRAWPTVQEGFKFASRSTDGD